MALCFTLKFATYMCIVGDDALHRPVFATSSLIQMLGLHFPLTLGPSFSVRPENEAKEGSQELRS